MNAMQKQYLRILLALISGSFACYYYAYRVSGIFPKYGVFAINSSYMDYIVAFALYLFMIMGIILRSIYVEIERSEDGMSLVWIIRKTLESKKLWMSLVASPYVFFFVYVITDSIASRLVDYLFALTSGFFWDAVLRKQN